MDEKTQTLLPRAFSFDIEHSSLFLSRPSVSIQHHRPATSTRDGLPTEFGQFRQPRAEFQTRSDSEQLRPRRLDDVTGVYLNAILHAPTQSHSRVMMF
jgi:hypothetical protein